MGLALSALAGYTVIPPPAQAGQGADMSAGMGQLSDRGTGMDLLRREADSTVGHFYRMEIMPGLFGDWSLVREWGRIGQPGQVRIDWFAHEAAAKDARFEIQMEKARKGYE